MKRESAAGPLADYSIGQRVMTREGFAGTIDDIHEGPSDLTTYFITLEGGMGGGEYAEAEIWPAEQRSAQVASVEHTAADDYPELGSILSDRLPPEIRTVGYLQYEVPRQVVEDQPFRGLSTEAIYLPPVPST